MVICSGPLGEVTETFVFSSLGGAIATRIEPRQTTGKCARVGSNPSLIATISGVETPVTAVMLERL